MNAANPRGGGALPLDKEDPATVSPPAPPENGVARHHRASAGGTEPGSPRRIPLGTGRGDQLAGRGGRRQEERDGPRTSGARRRPGRGGSAEPPSAGAGCGPRRTPPVPDAGRSGASRRSPAGDSPQELAPEFHDLIPEQRGALETPDRGQRRASGAPVRRSAAPAPRAAAPRRRCRAPPPGRRRAGGR